jgi:hypothetical protein
VAQEGLYQRLWQIQGVLAEDLRAEMGNGEDDAAMEPVKGARAAISN